MLTCIFYSEEGQGKNCKYNRNSKIPFSSCYCVSSNPCLSYLQKQIIFLLLQTEIICYHLICLPNNFCAYPFCDWIYCWSGFFHGQAYLPFQHLAEPCTLSSFYLYLLLTPPFWFLLPSKLSLLNHLVLVHP